MKTPIYFIDGEVVAESGNVKVYEFNEKLFLERGPGHNLWADSDELLEYADQLGNRPRGDCLEIGLGLGTASRYILSFDEVLSLTTVELLIDVVAVHKMVNTIEDERHSIVIMNGFDYMLQCGKKFHYIFMDFYDLIDEETVLGLRQAVRVAKQILHEGGKIQAWFDPSTPREFSEEFDKIIGG